MKDPIRAVLIDPIDDSRESMQRLFSGLSTVSLGEICPSYQGAARRVAELAPNLAVVNLDGDPAQAISLIQTIAQNSPGVVVLPASRIRDSSIILRVVRGAREFLTLPIEAEEFLETINRLVVRRDEPVLAGTVNAGPQIITVTGAAGGVGCTTLAVNLATTLAKPPTKRSSWRLRPDAWARSTPASTSFPTTPCTTSSRTSTGST